jgi:hypothetical protein
MTPDRNDSVLFRDWFGDTFGAKAQEQIKGQMTADEMTVLSETEDDRPLTAAEVVARRLKGPK